MANLISVWQLHGRREVGVYFSSSGALVLSTILLTSACIGPPEPQLPSPLRGSDNIDVKDVEDRVEASLLATCDNGRLDANEECDGRFDAACPGHCSSECACPSTNRGLLEMHVIDVGQGESILLISPDGFTLLYDTGKESDTEIVTNYITSLGLAELDYMVISHMHDDHMGAADRILHAYPEIVGVYDHGGSHDTDEFREYTAAAGIRRTAVLEGDRIDMGPSVEVEVLHSANSSSNENRNSVVVRVTYGDTAFLLGGDCDGKCEAELRPGQIDVFNVHHHGSSTATSSEFLERIDASDGIISVGRDNAYGHPTQTVLDQLDRFGIKVHRTDLDGHVVVVANRDSFTVGEHLEVPSADIRISKVSYDTPGTDSAEEYVEVYNPTASAVSLDGWLLTDGSAKSWAFPANTTVQAGARLSVARDSAGFANLVGTTPDVDGLTLSLNNNGDELVLFDTAGRTVDYVAWEGFEPGWSIAADTGEILMRATPDHDTDSVADWIVAH